jgi:hypothetical protein
VNTVHWQCYKRVRYIPNSGACFRRSPSRSLTASEIKRNAAVSWLSELKRDASKRHSYNVSDTWTKTFVSRHNSLWTAFPRHYSWIQCETRVFLYCALPCKGFCSAQWKFQRRWIAKLTIIFTLAFFATSYTSLVLVRNRNPLEQR